VIDLTRPHVASLKVAATDDKLRGQLGALMRPKAALCSYVAILVRGKGEIWCVYLPIYGCYTEQSRLHVVLACAEVALPYGELHRGPLDRKSSFYFAPALRRTGDSDTEENATRNTSVAVERSFLSADEK